jgi:hypothetical protein
MIDFNDAHWQGLKGGRKTDYDPRPALRRLLAGDPAQPIWDEFWEELHHQGNIGDASYASVPFVITFISRSAAPDYNAYGLISIVEIERHSKDNPAIPDWLVPSYRQAWKDVLSLASRDIGKADDAITIRTILGVMALAKGELKLGAFIAKSDTSEIDEFLEEHDAWSSHYEG